MAEDAERFPVGRRTAAMGRVGRGGPMRSTFILRVQAVQEGSKVGLCGLDEQKEEWT